MSIMRIHEVKHGPFHEHSSQLHSIAVGVASWAKVNSGLFKMYEVSREMAIHLIHCEDHYPASCIPAIEIFEFSYTYNRPKC